MDQTFAYWRSGGPLLIPIAMVGFAIWGYYLRSREKLAGFLREGESILQGWLADNGAGSLTVALDDLPGGMAAMLRASIDDAASGNQPYKSFLTRERRLLQMFRRDFVILSALTGMAPLLGLLGTVTGMIVTFDAVASASGNTGAWVADGVRQALITTQFGLAIALPGAFGLAGLQRMTQRLQALLAACRIHVMATTAASRRTCEQ